MTEIPAVPAYNPSLSQELLQSGILLFELPQSFDLIGTHCAEALPPAVDRLFADAVLLGDLGNRALVCFAQDRYGLRF